MKAKKITGAAGTTQVVTGVGDVRGFTLRESAGSPAAATVKVYDATAGSAFADTLLSVDLAASSSKTFVYAPNKPVRFKLGLRVVITGQVDGSLFVD